MKKSQVRRSGPGLPYFGATPGPGLPARRGPFVGPVCTVPWRSGEKSQVRRSGPGLPYFGGTPGPGLPARSAPFGGRSTRSQGVRGGKAKSGGADPVYRSPGAGGLPERVRSTPLVPVPRRTALGSGPVYLRAGRKKGPVCTVPWRSGGKAKSGRADPVYRSPGGGGSQNGYGPPSTSPCQDARLSGRARSTLGKSKAGGAVYAVPWRS